MTLNLSFDNFIVFIDPRNTRKQMQYYSYSKSQQKSSHFWRPSWSFLSFVKKATERLFSNGQNFKLQTMYKLMEQKVEMGPFERFNFGSGTL